mmetsp:Transcript_3515/g.10864  ORF Transcript_3515/g.10864 Transcript_3515/m.10864 type:complete len:805 (+) Transcript_3515:117-2531(+)
MFTGRKNAAAAGPQRSGARGRLLLVERRVRAAPGGSRVEEVRELVLGRHVLAREAVVELLPLELVHRDVRRRRVRAPEVSCAAVDLAACDLAHVVVLRDEIACGTDVVRPLAVVDRVRRHVVAVEVVGGRGRREAEREDGRVELGVLEHGATEEVVERLLVDLGVRQIHEVRREVVRAFDGGQACQRLADSRVAVEADARHDQIARHARAVVQDAAARLERRDLAGRLLVEHAEVRRDPPDVGDRDGVALVLDLLGPAVGRRRARGRVQLLPAAHLLHVRDRVVIELVVEGLDEVQIVDDLGAHRALAPRDDGDVARAVLERRADVFDREGAEAHDDDSLPAEVVAREVVADPAGDRSARGLERVLARVRDLARRADAVVARHHDARRLDQHGLATHGGDDRVPALRRQDARDRRVAEDIFVTDGARHAVDVREDLAARGMVAVRLGRHVVADEVRESIPALGGIHLRRRVGDRIPDASDDRAPLEHHHRQALGARGVRRDEAAHPSPDDDDVRVRRRRLRPGDRRETRLVESLRRDHGALDARRERVHVVVAAGVRESADVAPRHGGVGPQRRRDLGRRVVDGADGDHRERPVQRRRMSSHARVHVGRFDDGPGPGRAPERVHERRGRGANHGRAEADVPQRDRGRADGVRVVDMAPRDGSAGAERGEFEPRDLGRNRGGFRGRRKAAVRTRRDVPGANFRGDVQQAPRHELRMLDGRDLGVDDARRNRLARFERPLCQQRRPLAGVARIRALDEQHARRDLLERVPDLLGRDVLVVRARVVAPAEVAARRRRVRARRRQRRV